MAAQQHVMMICRIRTVRYVWCCSQSAYNTPVVWPTAAHVGAGWTPAKGPERGVTSTAQLPVGRNRSPPRTKGTQGTGYSGSCTCCTCNSVCHAPLKAVGGHVAGCQDLREHGTCDKGHQHDGARQVVGHEQRGREEHEEVPACRPAHKGDSIRQGTSNMLSIVAWQHPTRGKQ